MAHGDQLYSGLPIKGIVDPHDLDTWEAEHIIDAFPLQRLEATVDALGPNVDLSGAQIKGAVLASIFAARRRREPLSMPHLLRGLERELAKEGRTLGAREQERLMREA